MGAITHPEAFALFFVPLLCPHRHKCIPKRLNLTAQLSPLTLEQADTAQAVSCITVTQEQSSIVPMVLLPHGCSTPPLPGDCGQSPDRTLDKRCLFFPSTRSLHGTLWGPTCPAALTGYPCSSPQAGNAGSRHIAKAVCEQGTGSILQAHGGGPGVPTPAPGCDQGVGKGVCFPLRGRPWSCFLSALREP